MVQRRGAYGGIGDAITQVTQLPRALAPDSRRPQDEEEGSGFARHAATALADRLHGSGSNHPR